MINKKVKQDQGNVKAKTKDEVFIEFLIDIITTIEDIERELKEHGVSKKEIKRKIKEILDNYNLKKENK